MSNPLDQFLDKKKSNSEYLSLANGESCRVTCLREIKPMTKAGIDGKEKDILRFVIDVETPEGLRTKKFDNSSAKFVVEIKEKNVQLGSAFTLTRSGLGLQTKYTISEVTHAGAAVAPASQAPVEASPI